MSEIYKKEKKIQKSQNLKRVGALNIFIFYSALLDVMSLP